MKIKIPSHIVVLVAVLLLSVGCIAPIAQTRSVSRTTDTSSNEFATDAEKIAFLEKYVIFHSGVDQAEFHIVFHDNSGGLVPGPSDWDIRAVMRVVDADAWTKDKVEREPFDLSWAESLYSETMKPTSEPHFYESTATQLAVFEQERVILFYSTTTGE